MQNLRDMLIKHEGLRLKCYLDSKGIMTLGVGRNMESVGLTNDEAVYMLNNDIAQKVAELRQAFPWFLQLDPVRQDVVVDMSFMGVSTLKTFTKFCDAMNKGLWYLAATEMLNSQWAAQVHDRATELAEMMRTGRYSSQSTE